MARLLSSDCFVSHNGWWIEKHIRRIPGHVMAQSIPNSSNLFPTTLWMHRYIVQFFLRF